MTMTDPRPQLRIFAPWWSRCFRGRRVGAADPHYQPREGQLAMAQAVAHAMGAGEVLVAEAGTGVGKTYVPGARLASGERVLLSTATKALQAGPVVFTRYSPPCAGAGGSVRVALLKAAQQLPVLAPPWHGAPCSGEGSPQQIRVLAKIEEWSRSTRSGDLSTHGPGRPVARHSPGSLQRAKLPGQPLPQCQGRHVNQARRQAMAADLVVVNHHLFLPTWPCASRGGRAAPSVRVVVFDEAHQLSDAGLQFWGFNYRPGSSLNLPAMRSQPVWCMPVAMPIGRNWQLAWKARSCGGAMQRAMVLHPQESEAGRKVRPTVFLHLTGKLPWLRCSRHAACWRRRWTRTMTSPRTSPAWRSAVRPCWRA